MLGSLMMLASGFIASLPSSASSSLILCSGFSFSGKFAMMRPVSEMSFSFIFTPAVATKASTIGSRENVASPGASSTFVQTISRSDIPVPPGAALLSAEWIYCRLWPVLLHRREGAIKRSPMRASAPRLQPVQRLFGGFGPRHGGQRRQELVEIVDDGHQVEVRAICETTLDAGAQQRRQRLPVAALVDDHDRLGVQAERAPRQDLEELLECADAARQNDDRLRTLEHLELALVHVLHD